jgi:YfiH family protein
VGALTVRLGPACITFTDRHGGVSAPPFDGANLGDRTGDDPEHVRENRRRLAAAVAPSGAPADPRKWMWLHQVHGREAIVVDAPLPTAPAVDAVVTVARRLPLVVLTADCAPIALATDDAVAAVHAGWPGLLAGVVEGAVAELRRAGRGPVRAALGPCIHPDRYEFGLADLDRIAARLGDEVRAVTATGRPALDIPAAVRAALERAGVDDLQDVDVCTADSRDHFSYRRDGTTGRQALVAFLP